jgi:hypothetical protein
VRQTQSQASALTCNPNQYISNGQCVGSCPSGFYPDSNTRQCASCSVNCVSCFSASYCIICNTNYQAENGVCVSTVVACPSSQYTYKSKCFANCPIGTYSNGQSCSRICGPGTFYSNQVCYISCPSGLSTADACVAQCPAGTSNINGICS